MNKEEKTKITKEKLINATAILMENIDDPLKVTSREIASAAEVNPAMINYCFGSRENLIYEVFQSQYENFLNDSNVMELISSNLPPKQVLKELHFIVAKCLVENYKFTKAITGFVLFKRDLSQDSFSYPYVYKHFNGTKTHEECKFIAYEMSTTMQLIIYRIDDFKRDMGINLYDMDELKKYLDLRIDLLLGEYR